MTTQRNFAKSANRAMEIMDLISSRDQPVKAAEIADLLGLARSSVHQLLTTLVSGDYLICMDGLRYYPSPRSARIGARLTKCYPALEPLHEAVQELHDLTEETVTLSIQNDCMMRITAFSGNDGREWLSTKDWQVPVFGTAIGSAALADKPPVAVNRLANRARRQHILEQGVAVDASYLEDLRRFRMMGYSSGLARTQQRSSGDRAQPVWSVAIKLSDSTAQAGVVVGMSGPVWRVRSREREIVNIMHRTIRSKTSDLPKVAALVP